MKFVEFTRRNAFGKQKFCVNRDVIERVTPVAGSDADAGKTVIRIAGKSEVVVMEDYETVKEWLNG